MHYFDSDYMVGAHPQVLDALVRTNFLHTVGYGNDVFTEEARKIILDICGIPQGQLYFLEGGTQTNATVIDALLLHHQGVLSTDTAHINVHEAGAVEATGHKVISLPNNNGKIEASRVREYLEAYYNDDSRLAMVEPGMVYISHPTELGTLYTVDELKELREVCDRYNIPLYLDGARLAYSFGISDEYPTLQKIASLTDLFYIGGTKCGALFGEAVVSKHRDILKHFVPLIKQHGAMLAKGRLLGVQFKELFTDSLYYKIGEHGVSMAMRLKTGFVEKGYKLFIDSPTNQQFFILPNTLIERLRKYVSFENWGAPGKTESAVRFVTDFSTTEEDVDAVLNLL